jgi:hypothetical protein
LRLIDCESLDLKHLGVHTLHVADDQTRNFDEDGQTLIPRLIFAVMPASLLADNPNLTDLRLGGSWCDREMLEAQFSNLDGRRVAALEHLTLAFDSRPIPGAVQDLACSSWPKTLKTVTLLHWSRTLHGPLDPFFRLPHLEAVHIVGDSAVTYEVKRVGRDAV